jgi:hypothetical protein
MAHIAVPINEDVKENSLQKSFTFDYITGSRHELRQEPVTMAQQRPSQKRRQCVREFMCLCETEWHEHQRAKLYISASVIRATYISSRSVSPPDGFTICLESKPLLEEPSPDARCRGGNAAARPQAFHSPFLAAYLLTVC